MIDTVIQEFGASFGFDNLAFSGEDRVIHISVENVGEVYIEDLGGYMLMYVLREVDHPDEALYKKALQMCHHKERKPFNVDVGMFGEDQVGFSVRLEHEAITAPNLGKAYDFLVQVVGKVVKIKQ